MASIPIRSLTLYKQGIGYFERRGAVESTSISLIVPREATNDVLKSLNVIVHDGGQVLSIDYETPEDKMQVLSELSVKLSPRTSLVDLLSSLQGSSVRLQLENNIIAEGRIIGVEASLENDTLSPTVLLQNESDIQLYNVSRVQGLTMRDERAAQDVGFYLDMSRTEQTRTTLTVRLSDSNQNLELSYLAPSPTWRVSYRLVNTGPNQARLMGWGLFDNSLDEDLDNVSLTLISGRPISFEYGLYQSRVPSRPHVSDDSAELESLSTNPLVAESISAITHDLRSPLTSIIGAADLLAETGANNFTKEQKEILRMLKTSAERLNAMIVRLLDMSHLRDRGNSPLSIAAYRSGPLGDLKVSGSYFLPVTMGNAEPEYLTYHVEQLVSVKRGQSALVPILDAAVQYEELCVFNGTKMPNHPLLVWRLQNTAGVALEQGPVTVIHDGRYLGEGLMRFTGVDDDIQIAYALEFGVLVAQETKTQPRELATVALNSDQRKAELSYHEVTEESYTLTSHVNRDITLYIEQRDPDHGEYFEMPLAAYSGVQHTRWLITVPANNMATFTVRVRDTSIIREDIMRWTREYIEDLHDTGKLNEDFYAQLQNLLQTTQEAADISRQITELQNEYKNILVLQEQLRKNLAALGNSEREVTIRNRVLDDLETSENRRRDIEVTQANLERQTKENQTNQQSILNQIFA